MNSPMAIALAQAALGREVFPLKGKQPLVKWTRYATSDEAEVRRMFRRLAHLADGVGWRLPEGTVVLDIDNPDLYFSLGLPTPPALIQQTTRGFHLLYALDPDRPVKQGGIPGADLKVGGKGYVKLYSPDAFTRTGGVVPG